MSEVCATLAERGARTGTARDTDEPIFCLPNAQVSTVPIAFRDKQGGWWAFIPMRKGLIP